MKSNYDADLQLNSAAREETDLTDEHIRDLTAALAADVPTDFTKNVMDAIRTERKKIAFRNRLVRMGSAAVAALVIVPVAAIVLPAMIRGEKNADVSAPDNMPIHYVPMDTAAGDHLYSVDAEIDTVDKAAVEDESAPTRSTTNETDCADAPAPEATDAPGATDAPAAKEPTTVPAPEHMGKQPENPVEASLSADSFAADTKYTQNVLSESPVITVLRTLIGREKMDTWLSEQTDSENVPRALIQAFGITRENFLTAAADLNLTFTQDELDTLFDTPLTEK